MTRKKQAKPSVNIYEIEITLLEIKPRIWRRFAVPENIRLAKLHDVIQIVMGWTDTHLHQFIIDGRYYCRRHPDDDLDWERDSYDERLVKLDSVVWGEGAIFFYEYDFGDGWEHKLVVKKIGLPEAKVRCPICLRGKRACPPEDCGGSWGYQELIRVVADPNHEEHEDMMEWLGGAFNADAFHLEEINEILEDIC